MGGGRVVGGEGGRGRGDRCRNDQLCFHYAQQSSLSSFLAFPPRFSHLFSVRERWTESDIEPYIRYSNNSPVLPV